MQSDDSVPPTECAGALFRKGLERHQAGDLGTAEALYRQVLAICPSHFDAKHLLGVIALQTGRLDEAQQRISEALAIAPHVAPAHNNLGNVFLRQNRLEDAAIHFERALQLSPDFAAAHLNLGNVLRTTGKLKESAAHLHTAAMLDATSAPVHANLGATLLALADVQGAIRAFERAVELQPDRPEAYANLATALAEADDLAGALELLDRVAFPHPSLLATRGTLLARAGRYAEAEQYLKQALTLTPNDAAANANLGILLCEIGEAGQAIAPLQIAVRLDSASVSAKIALAQALREAGFEDAADEQLQMTLAAHPRSAEALAYLGSLCLERDDLCGAEAAWRDALYLQPDSAEVHYQFGNLMMLRGCTEEARRSYGTALAMDPDHARARWAMTMAQIPAVAADAGEIHCSRENFARSLAELDAFFDARRTPDGYKAVGSTQPFYLAYQARNNRELLARYGALCVRLMEAWKEKNLPSAVRRSVRKRIRVGFATAHIRDHSVWNAIVKGWVKNLDRDRFEIFLFHLGGRCDAETESAAQWADHFETGHHSLLRWARTIAGAELGILIYPEIGMDAVTTKLASLRLARVQAAAWGHPETSGLPTMDFYLSADRLEPEGSDSSYTEHLVRLPNLGVCYELREATPVIPDLGTLGLPSQVPLLLCPGHPFKYAPENDWIWAEISRRIGPSRLVFFSPRDSGLSRPLTTRIAKRYRDSGLDFERCVTFIPILDSSKFYGLMLRAHALLDTPGFSGFNTVMQAIECGLPVITQEGEFMRGRFGSGILRHIGLDDLVATTGEGYVELTVSLVRDERRRAELRRKIEARKKILFDDQAPLRALEEFLTHAVASHGLV